MSSVVAAFVLGLRMRGLEAALRETAAERDALKSQRGAARDAQAQVFAQQELGEAAEDELAAGDGSADAYERSLFRMLPGDEPGPADPPGGEA